MSLITHVITDNIPKPQRYDCDLEKDGFTVKADDNELYIVCSKYDGEKYWIALTAGCEINTQDKIGYEVSIEVKVV